MLKYIYLLITLSYCNFCLSQNDSPEVDTPLGKVKGKWGTSINGKKFASFEGIPFAKPPVGDLRFEDPQPVSPWFGTWNAYSTRACIQTGKFTDGHNIGSEDCLYLNVYVPAKFLKKSKELDVVVSIHGGAFMMGTAAMVKPDIILNNDIILVSISYRLGLFGFLSTEDDVIPGNSGLKDQTLALQWVKDNIESFGGNPNSVTIVGLSAGGASVHFHYFSPLSKGLFHRGMSQSGTAIASWALKKKSLESAKKLAELVGCPASPSEKLKACLKQKPAEDLAKQTSEFYEFDMLPLVPFGPVVEKGAKKPFLDKDPFLLLKEGKVLDVPWICSHTADEGLLPSGFYWSDLERIEKNWKEAAPVLLEYKYTLPESKWESVSKKIFDQYVGSEKKLNKKSFKKFTQMLTDRQFALPGELSAKLQAKATKSPVYYYIFNYKDGENKAKLFYTTDPEVDGVAHGEDGIYFYGILTGKQYSEQDKKLINACQNVLFSFASTEKPSFDGTDIWEPTGPSELTYLNISGPDNIKLERIEQLTPIDFWNKLGIQEYDNLAVKDEL